MFELRVHRVGQNTVPDEVFKIEDVRVLSDVVTLVGRCTDETDPNCGLSRELLEITLTIDNLSDINNAVLAGILAEADLDED